MSSAYPSTPAIYYDVPELYKNNPFAEAIPYKRDIEAIRETLRFRPAFTPEMRTLAPLDRLYMLPLLSQFFEPVSRDIRLYIHVIGQLLATYHGRSNADPGYFTKVLQALDNDPPHVSPHGEGSVYPSVAAIIGIPGAGKSSIIHRICASIPRVIEHHEYKGRHFFVKQVPWLLLSLAHDRSLKTLFLDAFSAYDAQLGTRFARNFANNRVNASAQLGNLHRVIMLQGTGLVCIDNVDHLSTTYSGGTEQVARAFYDLLEKPRTALILTGTDAALEFINREFRQSRRLAQADVARWGPIEGAEWDNVLDALWDCQLTRYESPLTQEIRDSFHHWTAGLPGLAIPLYKLVQDRAIFLALNDPAEFGNEQINAELVEAVASECYTPIRIVLDAIIEARPYEADTLEDFLAKIQSLMNPSSGQADFSVVSTPAEVKDSSPKRASVKPSKSIKGPSKYSRRVPAKNVDVSGHPSNPKDKTKPSANYETMKAEGLVGDEDLEDLI